MNARRSVNGALGAAVVDFFIFLLFAVIFRCLSALCVLCCDNIISISFCSKMLAFLGSRVFQIIVFMGDGNLAYDFWLLL